MFIHANEMRMKTTHHSFLCFTQKCGAEIRWKLRLLFLLESQNGLFPGFGLLLLDCVYLYGNGDVWVHSLADVVMVVIVFVMSIVFQIGEVSKPWRDWKALKLKACCRFWKHEARHVLKDSSYEHRIWCDKNVVLCTGNVNQCNAHAGRHSTSWVQFGLMSAIADFDVKRSFSCNSSWDFALLVFSSTSWGVFWGFVFPQ